MDSIRGMGKEIWCVRLINVQLVHRLLILSGDIISIHLLGKPAIIVNSAEAVHDLLDKRSANFSDRPTSLYHAEM